MERSTAAGIEAEAARRDNFTSVAKTTALVQRKPTYLTRFDKGVSDAIMKMLKRNQSPTNHHQPGTSTTSIGSSSNNSFD